MKLKWKIGIFGTDFDQNYLRNLLNVQIDENLNFVNFTNLAEFGIDPGVHPHQTCINFVSGCDIAFFFINKRYGGLYQAEVFWKEYVDEWPFDIAITHAEYRKAKIEKIPTIVFIHSKSYKEVGDFFLKGKKNNESDTERYKSIKKDWGKNKHYIKNPEVYCFIREAYRGIGKDQLFQSWIQEYSNDDLKNDCYFLKKNILNAIKSLTPAILRKLANKQCDALQKEPLMGSRVSYKFMKENDCLLDREAQDYRGLHIKNPKAIIHSASNHIMITGDANIGKTFFMIDLFGDDIESSNKILNRDISIFLCFKNRLKGTFDLEGIISNEMQRFSLPKYPFNLDTVSITLYIDGIGEGEYIDTNELKLFFMNLISSIRNLKLVISLRHEYYDWNYTTFNEIFEGKISIYRLLKIKANDGEILIRKVLKVLGTLSEPKEFNLTKIISNDLLQEPMHCVMASYVLQYKSSKEELNLHKVYDYYIELLAEHEVNRVGSSLNAEDFYNAWQNVAYILAWKKTKGVSIDCENLLKELEDKRYSVIAWKTYDSLIECIGGYARFKCDSYMDSLLSGMIIDSLLGKKENEEILAIDCYYDTSVFIKNRLNEMDANELSQIRDSLFFTAYKHIFLKNETDIRIAANCIYLLGLMGRINRNKVDEIKCIIRALKELTEKDNFISVDALFALTALGDPKAENELNKVLKKENVRKRNVDFHLIYFGVIHPQRAFPPNISIPNNGIDCTRLLNGIAGHFNRKEKRDVLRTRIDITIICDTLEIYHCDYSKNDALNWIKKFEELVFSYYEADKNLEKIIKESKDRLCICRERIEKSFRITSHNSG